jgi:hypothetical protein
MRAENAGEYAGVERCFWWRAWGNSCAGCWRSCVGADVVGASDVVGAITSQARWSPCACELTWRSCSHRLIVHALGSVWREHRVLPAAQAGAAAVAAAGVAACT